ncbi:PAS fold-containing protein [Streptomyces sp. 1222.5]|uniref:PP2C family protein-serine/threonine phosphatase n=1 Tax=unclassified Streptomyces TaxID=2593676 RepID=UPI000899202C|nr:MULTISPECIES: SpoIIE family protein phosphatase [unclassified Streptomyces]PKW12473.1 PAS domain-containing protein [Streptomyces sp. 5112.2]SEB55789.1 PAS fold-containing protein [Streptomyces sp. 1222.5]
MTIDYAAVFQALPGAVALLTPDLVFADANLAFLRQAGRSRDQVVGHYLFDVFPDHPDEPPASGARNLEASLRRVLANREIDTMDLQRYDVESSQRPGLWEERYWSPVNAPVFAPDGHIALVIHRVEEVTGLLRATSRPDGSRQLEAELFSRMRQLHEVNERLRRAHAREREVALALQRAMLPVPVPIAHHQVAVRYRPAVDSLNVCGDWYDLVELPDGDKIAVAVGDVVGHGLNAAGVMGQLRSALSATSRVATGPAQALEVLGRYAQSLTGAESTTAVTVFIDFNHHLITYSSAGHPPPVLLRGDGTVALLDQATDPPLDAAFEPSPRPEATTAFTGGDTLLLYTDGLIERRHQDIDTGLSQLTASLARHRELTHPEALADAVINDLIPADGVTDDTALVVVSL